MKLDSLPDIDLLLLIYGIECGFVIILFFVGMMFRIDIGEEEKSY